MFKAPVLTPEMETPGRPGSIVGLPEEEAVAGLYPIILPLESLIGTCWGLYPITLPLASLIGTCWFKVGVVGFQPKGLCIRSADREPAEVVGLA